MKKTTTMKRKTTMRSRSVSSYFISPRLFTQYRRRGGAHMYLSTVSHALPFFTPSISRPQLLVISGAIHMHTTSPVQLRVWAGRFHNSNDGGAFRALVYFIPARNHIRAELEFTPHVHAPHRGDPPVEDATRRSG